MTTGKCSINRGESANDDSESDREDLSRTEYCPRRTRQAACKQGSLDQIERKRKHTLRTRSALKGESTKEKKIVLSSKEPVLLKHRARHPEIYYDDRYERRSRN